jgi:hypothetical protein
MKKIALATTVLLSLAVTAPTSSFAAGSERYSTTIGGVEYLHCNDRELKGPTVTAADKPNARKRARNKARTELLRKLNVGGKIESRDRILANLGSVNVYERESGEDEYAYSAVMDITLCDRPE